MHGLDVVHQRHIKIGVKRLDLVEVERGEQSVLSTGRWHVCLRSRADAAPRSAGSLLNTARRSAFSRVIGRFKISPAGTSGASPYIIFPTWQTARSIPRRTAWASSASRVGALVHSDLSGNNSSHDGRILRFIRTFSSRLTARFERSRYNEASPIGAHLFALMEK